VTEIIVGVTGATGMPMAVATLRALRELEVTTHLVMTDAARRVAELETDHSADAFLKLADICYEIGDIAAPIASGSFPCMGMIVIPCSIKSLSAIANSYCDNLLTRAADVTLKERRKLVLVVREAPLHEGHLRLMLRASRAGAVIFPPVPSFYGSPESITQLVNQIVGRALDQIGVNNGLCRRWGVDVHALTDQRPRTGPRRDPTYCS